MRFFKPADIAVLVAAAALAVIPAFRKKEDGRLTAEIFSPAPEGGTVCAVYPLAGNRTVQVAGREGPLVIQIKEESISVTEAPCRGKLCVHAPPLQKDGEWTACIPGGVLIRLRAEHTAAVAGGESGLDAVSY